DEESKLSLRNSAAASVGKVAIKQVSRNQRTEGGDGDTAPGRAARRIHASGEASCDQKEGHYREADHNADQQAQNDQQPVFPVRQQRPAAESGGVVFSRIPRFSVLNGVK